MFIILVTIKAASVAQRSLVVEGKFEFPLLGLGLGEIEVEGERVAKVWHCKPVVARRRDRLD